MIKDATPNLPSTDIVERLCSLVYHEEWLEEAAAEIERLREQVAALQASSGYEASIAQVEIERLRKTAIETMHEMLRRANEIERLQAAIAHVRQRSAKACEILNDFDNILWSPSQSHDRES